MSVTRTIMQWKSADLLKPTLAKRYAGSCDVPDKCTPLTEKEEDNLKRRQNECPETRQLFQPYFGPGSKITKLEESKPCDQSAKLKIIPQREICPKPNWIK